jgi:hypothetical protein
MNTIDCSPKAFTIAPSFLLRTAQSGAGSSFWVALKSPRKSKVLTQEDFSAVSSRTYLSTLERALKSSTLEKSKNWLRSWASDFQASMSFPVNSVLIGLSVVLSGEGGLVKLHMWSAYAGEAFG